MTQKSTSRVPTNRMGNLPGSCRSTLSERSEKDFVWKMGAIFGRCTVSSSLRGMLTATVSSAIRHFPSHPTEAFSRSPKLFQSVKITSSIPGQENGGRSKKPTRTTAPSPNWTVPSSPLSNSTHIWMRTRRNKPGGRNEQIG